jgi:cyanate permease
VFAGWLVFLFMLLKSFIWNMYQAVLVTIVIEAEMEDQDAKQDDNS